MKFSTVRFLLKLVHEWTIEQTPGRLTPLEHFCQSLENRKGGLYLDYKRMVRPEVILNTYQSETYRHSEDFFFRSIHLATGALPCLSQIVYIPRTYIVCHVTLYCVKNLF